MTKTYKLRLACGSTNYDIVQEICIIFPLQRILQKRIKHLKFSLGILDEVSVVMEKSLADGNKWWYEFTGRSFDFHKGKDDIESIISEAE